MYYPIDQFAKDLKTALRKKTPYTLSNRDILHATEIALAGIAHAEQTVRILSHKLDISLYGDPRLQKVLNDFLRKKDSEMHILVESDINGERTSRQKEHPLLTLARQQGDTKIEMHRVPDSLVDQYHFNFMTIDDIGYRLEPNRKEFSATAEFYSDSAKQFVKELNNFFEYLRGHSTLISDSS